jgi:hypothetical protein
MLAKVSYKKHIIFTNSELPHLLHSVNCGFPAFCHLSPYCVEYMGELCFHLHVEDFIQRNVCWMGQLRYSCTPDLLTYSMEQSPS